MRVFLESALGVTDSLEDADNLIETKAKAPFLIMTAACLGLLLSHLLRAAILASPHSLATKYVWGWSLSNWLPSLGSEWILPGLLFVPLLAAASYLLAVFFLLKLELPKALALKIIAAGSVLFTVICTFQTAFFSTDVVLYHFLGVVQEQTASNPYLVGLSALDQQKLESVFQGGLGPLADTVVYGPALLFLYAKLALLSGGQLALGLFYLKVLSAVAFLLVLVLAWRLCEKFCPDQTVKIMAWLSWNPYLCHELVADAHNEVFLIAILLGTILALCEKKHWLACGLMTLAVYMKITLGIFVLFCCIYFWHQKDKISLFLVFFGLAVWGGVFVGIYGFDGAQSMFAHLGKADTLLANAFPAAVLHSLQGLFKATGWDKGVFKSLVLTFFGLVKVLRVLTFVFLFRYAKSSLKGLPELVYFCAQSYLWLYLFCTFFLWPHYFALPLILGLLALKVGSPGTCLYLSLVLPYVHLTQLYNISFQARGYCLLILYIPAVLLAILELKRSWKTFS